MRTKYKTSVVGRLTRLLGRLPKFVAASVVAAGVAVAALPAAWAEPGGAMGSAEGVDVLKSTSCPIVPLLAMTVEAGPSTHAVGSPPLAMAASAAPSKSAAAAAEPKAKTPAEPAPVASHPIFARDGSAAEIKKAMIEPSWTMDLSARLGERALKGNMMVAVYDAEDVNAVANAEVMELHQVKIDHTGCIKLRLNLDPNNGARPGHDVRVQLLQLIQGKKVLLAETIIGLR